MALLKILLLGASGYLGGIVADRLSSTHDLTLADLVPPQRRDAGPFVDLDITHLDQLRSACAGQDAVINMVALVRGRQERPLADFADVMVKGTWNVAEACALEGVRRLVNISSIAAQGSVPTMDRPSRESDAPHFRPGDLFYCLSKHLGEQIGLAYHQACGLSVIHLRPGVIAGDGNNPGPNPADAGPRPWFVYVDPRDVAQAVDLSLSADVAFGTYNIVAGRSDALFDWSTAARELGYRPEHNWPEIPEIWAPAP
ncbi:MAG: NAD(P)-dependent oxidoreductase [Armatimonadetes bacterium]|nr:NAD(P)-dependent oxidoreductase [Armatimonadota bacterium]